jgi:ketosteroid isomerase-like protein
MTTLTQHVHAFVELVERGDTVQAIERFYADDACVFENRELARAGRAQCVSYEREALGRLEAPPKFRLHRVAVNERDGVAFLEYTIRFTGRDGRPMRLDEVAVQDWDGDKITAERFYYEGMVDEGDSPTQPE